MVVVVVVVHKCIDPMFSSVYIMSEVFFSLLNVEDVVVFVVNNLLIH